MLIVEDKAYMRRTLQRFLQAAFPAQQFHVACNGERALARCRDHRSEIVLMDIELPDANGIEPTAQTGRMWSSNVEGLDENFGLSPAPAGVPK